MIEIRHIQSSENDKYKAWQKLLQRKYRDREGLFLIEGEVLIKDAISSGGEIKDLIVSSREEEPTKVFESFASAAPKMYMLNGDLFDKLSQTENGRLVIGVFRKPPDMEPGMESGLEQGMEPRNQNILILDRIQDPGNMGTLIRTADAAGFGRIIAIKGTVDPFSPKVVRSAAGSVMRVPITFMGDVNELKRFIKGRSPDEAGVENNHDGLNGTVPKKIEKIIASDMTGECDYWDEDLSSPIALVVGNEGSGVSAELMEIADVKVRIPMEGKIESLNAGISGALVMYEALRQQRLK